MPRRVQAAYNPPTQALEPVAAPQSRPFVPRLGPETILPVQELAGLSQTLSKITVQQAERDNEVARQKGLDAAMAAPADTIAALAEAHKDMDAADGAQRLNQEAFAKAMRDGKVDASQNPWVAVGFRQGAAHRLMRGYDAKLAAAMQKATATQDANGDPVVAQSPDAVIAEVWAEYKDNPILKDYYGSKVAQQMKAQADDAFVSSASKTLAENQIRDTITGSTNALTDKMFGMAVAGQDMTAETWDEIRGWAEELYRKTGGRAKAREIMLQAAQGVASRLDEVDGAESGVSRAAQFLRDFADAPVGSTTLGKDAVSAPELEQLIDRYEQSAKTKADNLGRAEAAQDNRSIDTAIRQYHARLDKIREGGGVVDPIAESERFFEEIRADNRFGDRTGLVVDAIQGVSMNTNKKQGALLASTLMKDMEGGMSPESALYSARVSYTGGGMSEESFRAVEADALSRISVRPLIENSPLSIQTHKEIDEAAELPGIPPELRGSVGVEEAAKNRSLVAEFNRQEVAAMKGILKLPKEQQDQAQRDWLAENGAKLQQALRDNGIKFDTERAKARSEVQQILMESQSPEQFLQENARYFSPKEADAYRAAAVNATDYMGLTHSDEYKDAEQFVLASVAKKYENDPEVLALVETARRELKRQFVGTVGGRLAGVDPSKKGETIYALAKELSDGVLERVASSRIAKFQELAAPGGQDVEEGKALLDFAVQDLERASTAMKDPAQAGPLLAATAGPYVSEELVTLQSDFLSGNRSHKAVSPTTGLPFGRVRSAHVIDRAFTETKAMLADPAVDDATKAQAAVDMRRGTLIPAEEVLAGKMTVAPSLTYRERLGAAYFSGAFGALGVIGARTRKAIQEELGREPLTVGIDKAQIPPYTTPFFRDESELKSWADDRPEDFKKLAERLGVPTDTGALHTFYNHQRAAIRRANQE